MINLFIGLVIGGLIGYKYRDMSDKIKSLSKVKEPEPEIGTTNASYGIVNPLAVTNQSGDIGLVEPKTPTLLEFEEAQRLKQMQYEVPKNGNDN
jgi:hypothetical protein